MRIAITGMGAHTPLGPGVRSIWNAVKRSEHGIGTITRFSVDGFDTQLGAMIENGQSYASEQARLLDYSVQAAEEALDEALGSRSAVDRSSVLLVLGTCNGLLGEPVCQIGKHLAEHLGVARPAYTFSTACASSTQAIGFAGEMIRGGVTDFVLAGGVDTLTPEVFAGFHSLGLLSTFPCAPFSEKLGTTLGEGAGFVFLESADSARQRSTRIRAELCGFGTMADAYHDTSPDPAGTGMARALECAINDTGLSTSDIDYLNAHGTGTAANDAAEWRAVCRTFGESAERLPVSSSKSILGHAQGAAGVLEAIITISALENGALPPTLNLEDARPNAPTDPVADDGPRAATIRTAVSSNAAFGGVNAALVFRQADALNRSGVDEKSQMPRPVYVTGIGSACLRTDADSLVPRSLLRGTDASTRLLAGAIGGALLDADMRLRTSDCEAVGLFAGQNRVSPESFKAFRDSVQTRGITRLSAAAFTRMVVNHATGRCCRLFGLKGPSTTIASSSDNGLAALLLGANHIAHRLDVDRILACVVSESEIGTGSTGPSSDGGTEGGISVLLSSVPDTFNVRVVAWAAANSKTEVIKRVLAAARRELDDVEWMTTEVVGAGIGGLSRFADVVGAFRSGLTGPRLIVSGESSDGYIALLIEPEGRS